ncbi:MAG: 30S ribosomal protein S15 [Candidatus Diapherotrites archaeon]|nr:30S ribosomal protein S15 [Candidatus Diapherotrites archaeon]
MTEEDLIKEVKTEEKLKKKKVSTLSDMPAEEINKTIIELANKGKTSAEIGMELRDQFGVLNVKKASGKKIEQVLTENKLIGEIPQDLLNLIKRSVSLDKHLKENKKDMTAKRGYQLTVSKIRRLVKYYHLQGKLPKGWRYTPEQAALLVK